MAIMNYQKTTATALCLSLAGLVVALPGRAQEPYSQAARIRNAQELLQSTAKYQASAAKLHEQMEATIKIADTLKGKATDLEIQINEGKLAPHLHGAQLK